MINIAFFGSSEYSTPVITALLIDSRFHLKFIVSKPGMTHYQTLLDGTETQLFMPENLKGENATQIKDQLIQQSIDLALVADYGLMIPNSMITTPPHAMVNIHFSDLPQLRGASPVQYTILQGKESATFTFLELIPQSEPEMDSGRILYKQNHSLSKTETTNQLYTLLFEEAAKVVGDVLSDYVEGKIELQEQNHNQATFTTPSGTFDRTTLIKKDDAYIAPSMDDMSIEQAIRAFSPWPNAWTYLSDLLIIAQRFDPSISQIRDKKDLQIRIQLLTAHLNESGSLVLDEVQADGKKAAAWKEFKNGYFA
ncbi:hypothetical protein KC571_01985 [candidate division WWE3 bacterium]|uniref:Methionyl-tRNA formyltransferase n=1 Tax=candidate division WWE3 bacterium TaxID=2053526 RepID=A0A955RQ23_UNCKA|nr:hypothetical protein [candidate division WWE3 bacterium]